VLNGSPSYLCRPVTPADTNYRNLPPGTNAPTFTFSISSPRHLHSRNILLLPSSSPLFSPVHGGCEGAASTNPDAASEARPRRSLSSPSPSLLRTVGSALLVAAENLPRRQLQPSCVHLTQVNTLHFAILCISNFSNLYHCISPNR
jgi:hypothetical protein